MRQNTNIERKSNTQSLSQFKNKIEYSRGYFSIYQKKNNKQSVEERLSKL